jgi:restriction system protein
MAAAWVIRAGRHGEREDWALQNGVSGGGWDEVPDLTDCMTRDDVQAVMAETFPTAADGSIANYTGQMWALRGRIEPGDLLVLPMKTTRQIAIGRVTSGYTYLAQEQDPGRRHVVEVDWLKTDISRTVVKQDLLFTLGSALTIFAPSKNKAIERLEALLATGTDPGQVPVGADRRGPGLGKGEVLVDETEDVDEPELTADIEEVAYDQILKRLGEDFAGHALERLVGALLKVDGLHVEVTRKSRDGGVDIVAGRGVLGLDDLIVAQVKSGSQVGSQVVNQLHGVMAKYQAHQGLLVAWGGLSPDAWNAVSANPLRVRVWEAKDVVDAVLANYERLDEEIRSELPVFKRVWMLADAGV